MSAVSNHSSACVICLESIKALEGEETRTTQLKCHHVFHSECIQAWLKRNPSCPTCRASMVEEDSEVARGLLQELARVRAFVLLRVGIAHLLQNEDLPLEERALLLCSAGFTAEVIALQLFGRR